MPVKFVRLPVFLLALGCALPVGAAGTDAKLSHEYDQKISASDISTDVRVLSSDAFAGRAPGTAGEQQTVNFLSAMLRQSGLQPGNGDSFFQAVPVISNTLDVAHSSMSAVTAHATQALKFGDDVVYSSTTTRASTTIKDSPLVFVGYGINAPKQGWDDYAGLDVTGKTVVILIGLPGGSTGAPFLTGTPGVSYYSRSSYKFEEAARHGVAAALIVHNARESGMEWDYIKSRYGGAQFQLRHEDDPEPDPPIVGWLSADAAKSLFAAAGMSLRDVRDAAGKRGFKAMPLGDAKLEAVIRSSVVAGESRNVIAKLPGAKYPDEAIVYSAHWDHFGTRLGMRGDNIFHGAIDNAMGVAGVLEIAAQFAAEDPKPDRSVIFFIPTLEEMGLLGSKYYTAHPVVPVANTVVDINFDVLVPVGVTSNLVVAGLGKSGLDEWVKRAAQKQDRVVVGDPPGMTDSFFRSDHLSFARAGVPVLYIRGGDKSRDPGVDGMALWNAFGKRYHTPADKFDPRWDLGGIVQDMQLACDVGEALAASREWPNWNEGTLFRAIRDRSRAGADAARH